MEISKKIPALKQLFLFDTCQAGGVEPVVAGLYDARISVLAKDLGMHIIAGSKSFQDARDDYEGNGLFTHFLLKGLAGGADENGDKEVSVGELGRFVSLRVEEASGGSQEPVIRNFGVDLCLGRVLQ
jgi:hypothetical protein